MNRLILLSVLLLGLTLADLFVPRETSSAGHTDIRKVQQVAEVDGIIKRPNLPLPKSNR
jgi:hypothetical protein